MKKLFFYLLLLGISSFSCIHTEEPDSVIPVENHLLGMWETYRYRTIINGGEYDSFLREDEKTIFHFKDNNILVKYNKGIDMQYPAQSMYKVHNDTLIDCSVKKNHYNIHLINSLTEEHLVMETGFNGNLGEYHELIKNYSGRNDFNYTSKNETQSFYYLRRVTNENPNVADHVDSKENYRKKENKTNRKNPDF